RVNVRLVAATNRDLQQQVKQGEFRADLYHRLSVYPIPIPPLRERSEDLPLLAGHFLEQNRSRLGLRSLRLAPTAELALLGYNWPGNIRELEHVISRAAIKALSQGAQRSDIVILQPELLDLPQTLRAPLSPAPAILPTQGLKEAVNQYQQQLILQALQQHQQCWSKAARALQLDASNLHKLAQRLGLK
ncbi:MAG: nitric oxide reductase transcription regulator, partial [Alishewanella sp. 34-51-39]